MFVDGYGRRCRATSGLNAIFSPLVSVSAHGPQSPDRAEQAPPLPVRQYPAKEAPCKLAQAEVMQVINNQTVRARSIETSLAEVRCADTAQGFSTIDSMADED